MRCGLAGSIHRSWLSPCGMANSLNVWPPSFDFHVSVFITYTRFGSRGWTRTFEMWRVSARPRCHQVLPASVERYTPSPCDTLPRIQLSPMPTYRTLGSAAAQAMAPTEARWKKPSDTFCQYTPPSVVFQTPPPVEPK